MSSFKLSSMAHHLFLPLLDSGQKMVLAVQVGQKVNDLKLSTKETSQAIVQMLGDQGIERADRGAVATGLITGYGCGHVISRSIVDLRAILETIPSCVANKKLLEIPLPDSRDAAVAVFSSPEVIPSKAPNIMARWILERTSTGDK